MSLLKHIIEYIVKPLTFVISPF